MHLEFAELVPHAWDYLMGLPRQGWVARGIETPETVGLHTLSGMEIIIELSPRIAEFSAQDRKDCKDMFEVHDYGEADPSTGDQISLYGVDSAEKKRLKFEREARVMRHMTLPLGEKGGRMLMLWHRFENRQDPVAKFAYAVDKYQAIEQAFRYEREQNMPGIGAEFVKYSPPITHPLLLERFKEKCIL